jgi:hypothetical protein
VEKVLPSVASLVRDDGAFVVLIKPQFEARREEVGKGGIVRQPEIHARVLGRFIRWATASLDPEILLARAEAASLPETTAAPSIRSRTLTFMPGCRYMIEEP